MEGPNLIHCAVICAVVILLCHQVLVTATPQNIQQRSLRRDESNYLDKSEAPRFFWLGPRSGRKKRDPAAGEENYRRNPENDREQVANFIETLKESPWAIVTLSEGRRHTVSFTPRLGRESGEEDYNLNGVSEDQWLQDEELSNDVLTQRSPPFTPRLGRRFSPFSPRLGREPARNLMP